MSADKSSSPIPFDLADAHNCPPPPHAHKSSITFAYHNTYLTISSTSDTDDDDDDNFVDHMTDTKDDMPLFFPKSSSILGVLGTNDSSTEVKYSHDTMMRNRPEVSFTLKKRKRVSPEMRLPIVQFPVLPLYPVNQEVLCASSTVEQVPRCKSESFKTEVRTSLPPNIKQRRRTSIARCA